MNPNDRTTLDSILPRLPAEAQTWIEGLDAGTKASLETVLNYVGPEAFARYWQDYKAEIEELDHFFSASAL
jgi:hypothetical protein